MAAAVAHPHNALRRWAAIVLLAIIATPSFAQLPELRIWGPHQPPAPDAMPIEKVRDLLYVQPPSDIFRHRLDIYHPSGVKQFPVVVLVHGGAWTIGDNRCCGLYTSVAEFLASRGIGVVMPNYRLSPLVKHPEHAKDVARAVAWTKSNIARYGGDPGKLFLAGHSAGGHLVALLATDERYLRGVGLEAANIRGVMGISGVYRIPGGDVHVTVGGKGGDGFHVNQVAPLRADGRKTEPAAAAAFLTASWNVNVYGAAFGTSAAVRADASPINHVRRDLPPFLIVTAENDLPTLGPMAEEFHKALTEKGCQADFLRVLDRNHNSIMFSAIHVDDPMAQAITAFVKQWAR
jgi:acetyl esterase/lipase